MAARKAIAAAAMTFGLVLAGSHAVGAEDALARGEELYNLCGQCHGDAGQGNPEALAPAIAGLPDWYVESQVLKFYDGVRGLHPDDIGGMRMRPMAMSLYHRTADQGRERADDDIKAIAAYVAAMPALEPEPVLTGGDPAKGEATYALCVACHGPEGMGNKDLQSPPIVNTHDWYMLTQLQNYKSGVRGADPGDMAGATMRPMAMTLADEQAMKDVIAYILTLRGEQ